MPLPSNPRGLSWACFLLLGCTRPGAGAEDSTSEGSGESSTSSSSSSSSSSSGSWDDSYCVAAGTLVSTPAGARAIEDLALGDLVYALDPHTGERFATPINFVRSKSRPCIDFELEGGTTLRCTHDHPLYSPDHDDYADARHWQNGELTHLLVAGDHGLERRRVSRAQAAREDCVVYDIGVEHELHNFLANRVLVHNKSVATYDSDDWSDSDESSFMEPDLGPGPCESECDIWDPAACPEGEKCTAMMCGQEGWNHNTCREIQGLGAIGDECMSTDGFGFSGNDTCDDGLFCWGTVPDPDATGTCVPFCTGSPDAPQCADAASCSIRGEGSLPLCFGSCDPLAQNCDSGVCVLAPGGEGFICDLNAVAFDAPYGESCDGAYCEPGLVCAPAEWVPELACAGAMNCCTPFCDTSLDNTCPGTGQECIWPFDPALPPLGYENVGICMVPPWP